MRSPQHSLAAMSSFIGHCLVGASLGASCRTATKSEKFFIPLFFAAIALSPDLDYLAIWLLQIKIEPRYTHSLAFCILMALLSLFLRSLVFSKALKKVPSIYFLLAPFTHIALDYFVGVHRNPIFWPFVDSVHAFPYGFLPSAGRLNFSNFYFWRNLSIELGILIPALFLLFPGSRGLVLKRTAFLIPLVSVFCVSVYAGLILQR
jgi:inner membrane protein